MALGLVEKQAIVAEVQTAAKEALSGVVADSRGVSVGAMTALRKEARDAGVWIKVVRNTLARRAVEGTDFECLTDTFVGPTLIAFSNEHPGAAARILSKFGPCAWGGVSACFFGEDLRVAGGCGGGNRVTSSPCRNRRLFSKSQFIR